MFDSAFAGYIVFYKNTYVDILKQINYIFKRGNKVKLQPILSEKTKNVTGLNNHMEMSVSGRSFERNTFQPRKIKCQLF